MTNDSEIKAKVMIDHPGSPRLELVAEWNVMKYAFDDPAAEKDYYAGEHFKKALLQGVKVDSQGNIYVSTARWGGPEIPATVSKLVPNNGEWVLHPYPNAAMNESGNGQALQAVLGFEIDRNDVMWILDQGHVASEPSIPGAEKLIMWDIKENKEIQRYEFTDKDSNKVNSFLNDVVVDNDSGFAYISDSGIFSDPLDGAIIVYDSNSNTARRVLSQTLFTNDEAGFQFRIDQRPVLKETPMRTGADGIGLSGDKETLYWTPLTGRSLWALDTKLLRDFSVPESVLRKAVRKVATLPSNTDGITCDRNNNLYMTALELGGLMLRNASTGDITSYVLHEEISWPDTVGWGPDGWLYFVSNHLHIWVDGDMDFESPAVPNFRIWRVQTGEQSYTAE